MNLPSNNTLMNCSEQQINKGVSGTSLHILAKSFIEENRDMRWLPFEPGGEEEGMPHSGKKGRRHFS